MGNRGILHDNHQNLRYYHKHKNWIICKLEFKARKRTPMTPGKYTELFFLDEATALSAGHRPCAECNRYRYDEFRRCWRQANAAETGKIDDVLHRENLETTAYLVLADILLPWSFAGYGPPMPRPTGREVTVLTPLSTVQTLANGYRPQLHRSATSHL
jgi:hypothetical protein